jgi:hypothetical protein
LVVPIDEPTVQASESLTSRLDDDRGIATMGAVPVQEPEKIRPHPTDFRAVTLEIRATSPRAEAEPPLDMRSDDPTAQGRALQNVEAAERLVRGRESRKQVAGGQVGGRPIASA